MRTVSHSGNGFRQTAGLPFSDHLSEGDIQLALSRCGVKFRDRVFSPEVTIWSFLSQCLSQDGSCREAVARVVAHRSLTMQPPCSPNTAAYTKARSRLPEPVLRQLLLDTARRLESGAASTWKWHGRDVVIVDGSGVSMPDTEANRTEFPIVKSQQAGLGFPIARIGCLFSLATGTILDVAIKPFKGKQTGEEAILREMMATLKPGDVLMGDRLYDSYWTAAMMRQQDVDVVFRMLTTREKAKQVSDGDQIVIWSKAYSRPKWMPLATYRALPNTLKMREIRTTVAENGRAVKVSLVTSLLDQEAYPADDLIALYRQRWQAELDLRSVKTALDMDVLRCKTPEMVRKEIYAYLLAYNLLRATAAEAASWHNAKPREISFTGTLQTVQSFSPAVQYAAPEHRPLVRKQMLKAIASHRVGNRPDRWEPRAVKRRPKCLRLLTVPRNVAKLPLMKQAWS